MSSIPVTESLYLDDILSKAGELNLNSNQTLELLRNALDLAKGKTKRIFAYSEPLAAELPEDCRAQFARGFAHTDWIDGESVVQAEKTSLEDGFNKRFHDIEKDLDALGEDIARAFVCLGKQRSVVSRALDEIRSEINRIHSDLYDCCQDEGGPVFQPLPGQVFQPIPWPIPNGPTPIDPTGPTGPIGPIGPIWPIGPGGNLGPWINPGVATSTPWGADVIDPVENYLETVRGYQTYSGASSMVIRSNTDRTRSVIAGLPARLIEENEFNGQSVEVWSTSVGLILTPLAEQRGEQGRAAWKNPRVDVTTRFARWSADNEADVRRQLGRSFSLADFVKTFGEQKVSGGVRIADIVDRLPTDLKATSPLELIVPLADVNGKAIVREGYASETVIGAVGLNVGGAKGLETAAVKVLKSLETDVAKELSRVGVKTLGELAKRSPSELTEVLANVGIGLNGAAELIAEVNALIAVDRVARGAGGRDRG